MAVDEADIRQLLDEALEAWRARPHPRLAEAVELLREDLLFARGRDHSIDRVLDLPDDSLTWLSNNQADAGPRVPFHLGVTNPGEWSRREELDDPLDLIRLFPTRSSHNPLIREQLEVLSRRDDPGFAPLLSLVLRPREGIERETWDLALRLLAASQEGRSKYLDHLRAAVQPPGQDRGARLSGVVAHLTAAPLPPLLPEDEAFIDLVHRTVGPQVFAPGLEARVTRLMDAVLADPDDDVPRRVLADLLLQEGDLRGEFLQRLLDGLEVSETLQRRARSAWLPTTLGSDAYRRGFPETVWLPALMRDATDVAQPWFRLVRQLRCSGAEALSATGLPLPASGYDWLEAPNAQGIRRVFGVQAHVLAFLGANPRPWTHLEVEHLEELRRSLLAPFAALTSLVAKGVSLIQADAVRDLSHLESLTLELWLAEGGGPGLELPPSLKLVSLFGRLAIAPLSTPLQLDSLTLHHVDFRPQMLRGVTATHFDLMEAELPDTAFEGLTVTGELILGVTPTRSLRSVLSPLRRLPALDLAFSLTPVDLLAAKEEAFLKGWWDDIAPVIAHPLPPRHPGEVLADLDGLNGLRALTLTAFPEDLRALPHLPRLQALILRNQRAWNPTESTTIQFLLMVNPQLQVLSLIGPSALLPQAKSPTWSQVWKNVVTLFLGSDLQVLGLGGQLSLRRSGGARWTAIVHGEDENTADSVAAQLAAARALFTIDRVVRSSVGTS